jgi:putative membrane protein insertion efficiency factor
VTTPPGIAARVALTAIVAYQRSLSPLLPAACRFWPSCSEYARQAIARRGLLRGGAAALGRVLRCQPLFAGGIDPPR